MTPRTRSSARAQDLALVLRRFRYHESSLVCHLLTREHGRVSVLAKGAYRAKSAYSGVLDLFDTLALEWSPGDDLGQLRSGHIERRRRSLSRDLERYRAGLRVLELAGFAARSGRAERGLFDEVERGLDALASGRVDPALGSALFDLLLLRRLGLAPALVHCAQCGAAARTADERARRVPFAPALGGRLCEPCAAEVRAAGDPERFRGRRRSRPLLEEVDASTLRVADSLAGSGWTDLARVRLDPGRTAALRSFVARFLEYHLETRPRASGPLARRAAERA